MNYIIFDFEWNNAFNYAIKKSINEIIEIGAVKLDRNLNIVDTFKQLIKPKVSRKLSSRCKNLTNISMEEIKQSGVPFEEAFRDFARWSGGADSVFLSWSDSDLYVLADNFSKFSTSLHIDDFMKRYCDAQKYCMSYIDECDGHTQIGLSRCAEIFGIKIDALKLHRALADCYVTAECLKAVYDADKLATFTKECDRAFFERLIYKPYYINKPKTDDFNINDVDFVCMNCNCNINVIKGFENANNTFKTIGVCSECNRKFWLYVRAKKTYDGVIVSNRVIPMNKKKARKINS